MTGSDSITHLGEHASNETQTCGAEELRGMEGSEKGWSGWSARRGGGDVLGRDGCWFIMVTCLLEEVEQIFAGDVLEQKEEECRSLKCAIKGDDVGMGTKRLVDSDLWKEVRRGAYMALSGD